MDQFASKIVEKCLKIGGSEFLDRYLGRVCTGRSDRPRMPLIDSKSLNLAAGCGESNQSHQSREISMGITLSSGS